MRNDQISPISSSQITQFCVNLGFLFNAMRLRWTKSENDCDFPFWMVIVQTIYMLSFLALFGNFYLYTYITSRSSSEKQKKMQ
jgi:hypothetical protein